MSYLSSAIHAFMSIPGLRGFWPLNSFDESGNAYDLSRHGHTLTLNNTLTYGIDLYQGAGYAEFGSPGYLSRADAANFDILGTESYVSSGVRGLTLGGWFWFPSFSGVHQAINKSDFINNCSYELTNVSSGSALFRFGVSGDGTSGARKFATMAGNLSAGQWHFLVGRYTPSTEVAIFSDTAKAVNTTSIPASIFNGTREFRIDDASGTRAALCFLSAEVIPDALLTQLYEDSWPLFHTAIEAAETVTLTETVSRRLVSLVKPNQAVTLSEAQTVRLTRQTSQAETVTLSETVTKNLVSRVSASETVTLTEAQTVSIARSVSAGETVTLSEAQMVSVSTAAVNRSETVTLTETVTVNLPRSASVSETVTLAEAVAENLTGLVSAADTVTLSETVTRNLVSLVSTNQAVTLTEAQTVSMARQVSAASDTVTLSEAQSVILAALVGQNETVTLTEAVTVVMMRTVNVNETVTLAEGVTVSMTRRIAAAETATLTEAVSVILAEAVSTGETITLSETGTTVVLISVVGQNQVVTLGEAVTVALAAFSVSAAETVTVGEIVLVNTGTGLLVSVSEVVTLVEAATVGAAQTITIIVYDTLSFTETFDAPLASITDTLTLSDDVISNTIIDTLTLTDEVTIGNVTMVIEDTLTFTETLELSGPPVPPPATAAVSELDYNPVLKLLYGNDKRNPIRELDLAQLAPGEIRLMAGGFAPGAGERNELWSGESIRFDGQKKLAESLKNSELAVTYALKTGPLSAGSGHGSQAALSYFQRKVSRFFAEAKLHQLRGQSHTVWLEYRWSDGLTGLTRPAFGQLSNYYEVYSATAPKWPDDLHDDISSLTQGLIAGVVVNLTASPAPEGLRQRAALAAGPVSLHAKGVLIASGASSKLHWAGYTDSGLTGQFSVTGWITTNAVWGSGTKYVFDYYVDASNRISIVYNATSNVWTITKIVSGSIFTVSSSADTVTSGDDVHLQLVQNSTTLYLFVNGVQAASVAATATMTDGGTIALGCPATGTIDGVDVILDGWRILPDDALTSTEALALYQAELPIKEDGGQVGPTPYWWTKDGDGQVDNCDDTSRDNWGIIGGVGGDLEALTEFRIQTAANYGNKVFWLGIRTQDNTFTPASTIYLESADEVAEGAFVTSGGFYETEAGTSLLFSKTKTNLEANSLYGQYRMLARLWQSPAANITFGANYAFSASGSAFNQRTFNKEVSITGFRLIDFGDFFIGDNTENIDPVTDFVVNLTAVQANGVTVHLDFIQFLPAPFARISTTQTVNLASDYLIIQDGQAFAGSAAYSGSIINSMAYRGQPLRVFPYKYNYLFFLQETDDDVLTITQAATITAYVTPRYLLPGGMVA